MFSDHANQDVSTSKAFKRCKIAQKIQRKSTTPLQAVKRDFPILKMSNNSYIFRETVLMPKANDVKFIPRVKEEKVIEE